MKRRPPRPPPHPQALQGTTPISGKHTHRTFNCDGHNPPRPRLSCLPPRHSCHGVLGPMCLAQEHTQLRKPRRTLNIYPQRLYQPNKALSTCSRSMSAKPQQPTNHECPTPDQVSGPTAYFSVLPLTKTTQTMMSMGAIIQNHV